MTILLFCVFFLCYPVVAQTQTIDEPLLDQFAKNLLVGSETPLLTFSDSDRWLRGLSVSGFVQNTSGVWIDSSGLRNFGRQSGEHHNGNSLAVERNLVQLDLNYELNPDNRFFLRFWGVYEPPYAWESGTIAGPTGSFDHSQSQIYNRYDVREAYWKAATGPFTLFLGRQIVTWGESISFRIGDVVNPQDLSWNFGFANLEQSRMPLWMLHPIMSLESVGPFSSNFVEGVFAPPWQPLYTGVSYADRRYSGQYSVAGSVNLLPPGGGRFDTYPYPFDTLEDTPPEAQAAFPQVRTFANPAATYRLPAGSLEDSTGGIRLHTIAEDAELTGLYWHGHQFNPSFFVNGAAPGAQNLQFRYPQFNDFGATINRPIYFGGTTLAAIPLVTRGEAVWQDRTPFNTLNVGNRSAVAYSDTLNTLLALDLDQASAGWLSSTGSLTANLELNNYTIFHPNQNLVYSGYAERWRHNEENILLNASTSWWWGAVVPTATAIYNPDGNTWELFPNIVITPPWTSKYSMMLQYIGILSNDKYSAYAGGVFKGKSMFLVQFQYNFMLVQGRN
jgi:hypothetical protein